MLKEVIIWLIREVPEETVPDITAPADGCRKKMMA